MSYQIEESLQDVIEPLSALTVSDNENGKSKETSLEHEKVCLLILSLW